VLLISAAKATQSVVAGPLTALDWIIAGGIFVAGIAVGRLARAIIARAVRKGDSEVSAADTVGRLVGYLAIIGGLVYGLSVLGVRLGPLVGALGISGLAIAFAAQSILSNFLASVILQLRRPFRRGDQISTGQSEGTVEEVNFRTVVLRAYDGQRVMVPCASVLSNPIVNHTRMGRRRTSIDVGVGYDADLDQARKVMLEAVRGADGVFEKPEPEVWVESFGDSAVNLVVRYWHKPDSAALWRVRSAVAVAVKESLDGHGIDMPFPIVTVHQPPKRRS
jgi:small-conductance mechanosensitive channel